MSELVTFLIALPFIAAFSALLVFLDPLTLLADWWENRR